MLLLVTVLPERDFVATALFTVLPGSDFLKAVLKVCTEVCLHSSLHAQFIDILFLTCATAEAAD